MNRYAITPLAEDPVVLKLDDCGDRANKDELAKLVMELVSRDKREHPFKDDGPHRHWFQVVAPSRSHPGVLSASQGALCQKTCLFQHAV